MDNGSVGQRLDRGDTDECRHIEIEPVQLVAMIIEKGPEQALGLAMEQLDALKLAGSRRLFGKDAMKCRIDAMRRNSGSDEPLNTDPDRFASGLSHRFADDLHEIAIVALDDGGDQCLLAREILIERTDADASRIGDPIRTGSVEAVSHQNARVRSAGSRAHYRGIAGCPRSEG